MVVGSFIFPKLIDVLLFIVIVTGRLTYSVSMDRVGKKKGYGEKLWRIFCTRTKEPKIQTNCSHQITKFDVNQKRMVFRDMGEIHVG